LFSSSTDLVKILRGTSFLQGYVVEIILVDSLCTYLETRLAGIIAVSEVDKLDERHMFSQDIYDTFEFLIILL